MLRCPVLACVSLLITAPAAAATIDFSASVLNGNTATDLGLGAGRLGLEIDLNSAQPIDLAVDLEPGEEQVALHAIVFNFLAEDLASVELVLGGDATLSLVGDASDGFGAPVPVSTEPPAARIFFPSGEPVLFTIGDPLAAGLRDWQLEAAGRFSISIAPTPVPEPTTATLIALGLALVGGRLRRR